MTTATSRIASHILPNAAILTAFALAMLVTGGASLDVATIAWLTIGSAVIVTAGLVVVAWVVGDAEPPGSAMAILLGSITTSLVLVAGCALTGRLAGTIFIWWSVIVVAAAVFTFRARQGLSAVDRTEVVAVAAIAVLVAAWCHHAAGMLPRLEATAVASLWSDYSIHGTEIAQFGDPHMRTLSSFLLEGQPLVFYHYGAYMLAAAAADVVSLPPWGMAASVLLPVGILQLSLAVYAFARTRADFPIALVVPFALLLVPDASTYGLQNGFFGFHWLLFTAPGSGYGLAAVFTSLTLMSIWRAKARPACFWLGVAVALAAFEFRAQIFVLFAPALTMTLACGTSFVRRRWRSLILASLVTMIAAAAVPTVSTQARDAWLRFSALQRFLTVVHTGMAPTPYDGVYQAVQNREGPLVATTIGLLGLIPAAIGVLTLALPAALIVAVRRTGWRPLDLFPIWLLAAWLGVILFAPSTRLDHTEYQHRPFVLVYAAALVWTLLLFDRAARARTPGHSRARFVVPAVACAALAIGAIGQSSRERARPRFTWGMRNFEVKIDRGVIDAAAFMRSQATLGDTFAVIPTDASSMLDDDATRLAALSGVPAYLARAGIQALNGQDRRAVVEQRLATLKLVESTSDADAAFRTLRAAGVEFVVFLGDRRPQFDPSGARGAFRTTGTIVYHIQAN
jgi:hypothetical protein